MRYAGSKKKFMKQLLPIIMKGANEDTHFIDCFGGGMNVISEVPLKKKMAIEFNFYVFSLWDAIKREGLESLGLPKNSQELTEEKYNDVKQSYINKEGRYSNEYLGFVGACCSYGGSWFNGYAHFNYKKNEDHIAEAYNGLKKQVESFKNLDTTTFHWQSYHVLGNEISLPKDKNVILFCDPPYFDTKKYETDFDHEEFWSWVKMLSEQGYKVFVTEYIAPDFMKCVWKQKKPDTFSQNKKNPKIKIEKLFVYNTKKRIM